MKLTCRNKFKLYLTGGMYLYLAFLILFLPLRWLAALAVSTLVHELFHMAAIRLCGLPIHSVRLGVGGAVIHTPAMTDRQELLCALAGPLGGLCLLFFGKWLPMTAICAAFQSIYNLLPLYPSDGGRILRCGARIMFPERTALRLCKIIETGFLVCAAVLGLYGTCVLRLGLLPVLISVAMILRTKKNSLQS